jgi:hypothetical protein
MPIEDTYMGSYCTWIPQNKSRLIKIILKSDFKNRKDTMVVESKLIKENINNELNRNYNIPGIGFINNWTGKYHSIDTKKKMSESKKGKPTWNNGKTGIYTNSTLEKMKISALNRKKVSDDTKRKISESLKGKMCGDKNAMYGMVGDKNPNYGNNWTIEQKIEQSKKLKGHNRTPKKSILQYSLNGIFIKEWDGLIDASKELNLSIGGIGNCLANRYKNSGGFIWKYKNINNN